MSLHIGPEYTKIPINTFIRKNGSFTIIMPIPDRHSKRNKPLTTFDYMKLEKLISKYKQYESYTENNVFCFNNNKQRALQMHNDIITANIACHLSENDKSGWTLIVYPFYNK